MHCSRLVYPSLLYSKPFIFNGEISGTDRIKAGRTCTMKNLLTDIAGVRVGHADDAALASGVTAVVFDAPVVAAIDVRGGGPGTREGALLDAANTVEKIDAIALAGGSAFGLEAGGGVQAWLAEHGRGFAVRGAIIPIVPGAIMFDLLNGGDKAWGRFAPYRDLAYTAAAAAATNFALGSVGAGLGATTANFKGGIGSGSAANPGGGRGGATPVENTPLAWAVTEAGLNKPQAKRLAVIAQTGFARAIYPVHAPLDGDVLFAAATGEKPVDPLVWLTGLGMVAANTVARAIARGVYAATALPFLGALPAWRDRFG